MKNYTEIVCVIDKSGSMSSTKNDAIGGFNSFLNDQKAVPGAANITVVLFDTTERFLCEGVDIKKAEELTERNYVPSGNTALLDAVGAAIHRTGRRLSSMKEKSRPNKVLFVIITDGEENSSTAFKLQTIKDMITLQTDVYNWQFMFLGANQDAFAEAGKLGINNKDFVFNFSNTGKGVRDMYSNVSLNTTSYRVS